MREQDVWNGDKHAVVRTLDDGRAYCVFDDRQTLYPNVDEAVDADLDRLYGGKGAVA